MLENLYSVYMVEIQLRGMQLAANALKGIQDVVQDRSILDYNIFLH